MPRCWIFRSSVSCSTLRACICACLERNAKHRCIFWHTRGKQIPSTKLCPPEQANTDEQRSHCASDEDRTVLTSSSHVLLWHVYQGSNWSYCVKTVLLIERHSGLTVIAVSQWLNFKSRDSFSALDSSVTFHPSRIHRQMHSRFSPYDMFCHPLKRIPLSKLSLRSAMIWRNLTPASSVRRPAESTSCFPCFCIS